MWVGQGTGAGSWGEESITILLISFFKLHLLFFVLLFFQVDLQL